MFWYHQWEFCIAPTPGDDTVHPYTYKMGAKVADVTKVITIGQM
jgi:hypothetical protein